MNQADRTIQPRTQLVLLSCFCAMALGMQVAHAESSGACVTREYSSDGTFGCRANAGMTNAEWERRGCPAEYSRCLDEAARKRDPNYPNIPKGSGSVK